MTDATTTETPDGFTIHCVRGWLPSGAMIVAEDFPSRQLALRAYHAARRVLTAVPEADLEKLSDDIAQMLDIDPASGHGCCIVVDAA